MSVSSLFTVVDSYWQQIAYFSGTFGWSSTQKRSEMAKVKIKYLEVEDKCGTKITYLFLKITNYVYT